MPHADTGTRTSKWRMHCPPPPLPLSPLLDSKEQCLRIKMQEHSNGCVVTNSSHHHQGERLQFRQSLHPTRNSFSRRVTAVVVSEGRREGKGVVLASAKNSILVAPPCVGDAGDAATATDSLASAGAAARQTRRIPSFSVLMGLWPLSQRSCTFLAISVRLRVRAFRGSGGLRVAVSSYHPRLPVALLLAPP